MIINVLGPLLVFVGNKINADRMLMAAVLFGVLVTSVNVFWQSLQR
ncbi:hypothetical protein [Domibacillus sp. PGB-M46]|nr:hypothetical protein [Domibacillus sp. PGB-M46]